jgi:hypothetical protein
MIRLCVGLVCALALCVSLAAAQAAEPPRVNPLEFNAPGAGLALRPDNPRAREVLEKVLIARLSEDLALDDAQTVLLVRRYTEVREKLGALRQKRNEKLRELREAVESNQESDRLSVLLDEMHAIDREMEETKRSSFDTMSADLTPWQKARLYIFLSEFEGQLRRWLNEVRRERAGQRENRPQQRPDKPEKSK